MKEATGELNMTVVTLVAIAAIGAVFYLVVWPLVQRTLVSQTCRSAFGPGWHAVEGAADKQGTGNSQATVSQWMCCPEGVNSGDECENANTTN